MISAMSQNSFMAADPASSGSSGSSATTATGGTSQVTKNMFLQLLVAQIKHQDPMSPSDGVQFLTQLAQFQQLEQSMNLGTDLSAIRSDLEAMAKSSAVTGTTTGTATDTNSIKN
jgi:flagellar basal-body rod modification protein FlgD